MGGDDTDIGKLHQEHRKEKENEAVSKKPVSLDNIRTHGQYYLKSILKNILTNQDEYDIL